MFLEQAFIKIYFSGFPGGSVVKNPPINAEDLGLIPVREDPTGRGATKPALSLHAATTEPLHHN